MYNFQIILMSFTVVPIRLVLVLLPVGDGVGPGHCVRSHIIFSIITDHINVVHRRAYPSGAGIAPVGDGVGPGDRVRSQS